MKKVFAVLIEWVCNDGSNGSNVFLFDNIEKARKHLGYEAASELNNRRNDSIYYDKNKNAQLIECLLKELGNDFKVAEEMYDADYVIETSPNCFCCFKAGEYLYERITINIIEKSIK